MNTALKQEAGRCKKPKGAAPRAVKAGRRKRKTDSSEKMLLEMLCERAGVTVDVQVKDERIRPVDTRELLGDNSKIKLDTGWEPRIPIEETLESLLHYWEREIGSGAEASSD